MRRMVLALMLLALAACAASPAPSVPDGLPPPRFPTDDRAQIGLAFLDVETTGLDPRHHEMIDLGLIYADLDGRELGRLYVRILPDHPERLSPGAKAVNGFDVAFWRAHGAVSEEEAVARLLDFHAKTAGDRQMLMTAWNVQFDHAFLDALLRQHGRSWRSLFHYHALDLPSMAWGLGLEGLSGRRLAEALGIAPETDVPLDHTGITGADFNLAAYRALRARR
jgi:oligoribonuclease (3'-5' exoribonuclease)